MWARRISTMGGIQPPLPVKEESKPKKVRARAKPKNKNDTSQITSNDDTVIEAGENEEDGSPSQHVEDDINKKLKKKLTAV